MIRKSHGIMELCRIKVRSCAVNKLRLYKMRTSMKKEGCILGDIFFITARKFYSDNFLYNIVKINVDLMTQIYDNDFVTFN